MNTVYNTVKSHKVVLLLTAYQINYKYNVTIVQRVLYTVQARSSTHLKMNNSKESRIYFVHIIEQKCTLNQKNTFTLLM